MDLQARKLEFIQEFVKLQSEEVITLLENLLKQKKSENNDSPEPMTVTELNTRISKSEDDFKSGRYKTSAQLLEKYR
ncbi:hypothetical protein [Flavobacterium rhizosphaerae]|uniref:Addiction module component n=1 Tax=Flavobacterium rhizosphaerae TaxID=3163298 RepID=A0ABW8Z1B5_9FLAO